MTKVEITRRDEQIVRIECDGHTGYGVEGEDIVCAALSSVVQTALLGLLSVAAVPVDYKREKGGLTMAIPGGLDYGRRKAADIILETMLLGVADLHEGFSDFVELKVINEKTN